MTEEQYERERQALRDAYGNNKTQAGARWEQELAKLFDRSGWTQEQLAKKEGMSQRRTSELLKFGQFLGFSATGAKIENGPVLNERSFRKCWAQTSTGSNQSPVHDRDRFREVARMIADAAETGTRKKPIGPDVSKKIVKKLGDGQWHTPKSIASAGGIAESDVPGALGNILKFGLHNTKAEKKKVGKEFHYRIFKLERSISLDELIEKLTPIIKALDAEGRKTSVTTIPGEVRNQAIRLKKLLDEWTEPSRRSLGTKRTRCIINSPRGSTYA